MERELAYDLLDIAVYINSKQEEPLRTFELVSEVTQYIDDNYSHDFYIEYTEKGKYMPFLYEHLIN